MNKAEYELKRMEYHAGCGLNNLATVVLRAQDAHYRLLRILNKEKSK